LKKHLPSDNYQEADFFFAKSLNPQLFKIVFLVKIILDNGALMWYFPLILILSFDRRSFSFALFSMLPF